MIFRVLLFITLVFLLTSCSGNKTYSKVEIYKLATKFDSTVELMMPEDMTKGVTCDDYGEGCITGFWAKVRLVRLTVVEFENEEFAKKEAIRLKQYYSRNWLFDDVTDEPVLEDFVKKVYEAKNPSMSENPSKK